jgi:hypothetical protein
VTGAAVSSGSLTGRAGATQIADQLPVVGAPDLTLSVAAPADAERVRSDLEPRLDPEQYAVARYPGDWRPAQLPDGWSAFVRDGDEVTVVAAQDVFDAGRLGPPPPVAIEAGWRRITFPGPLPWELVGFLADVAHRLAEAHVPFTSMSGFTTDHLLVRSAHADLAVSVLRGFPAPPHRPGTNP